MLIIESILGNIRDKQWQDRAEKVKVDYLTLNQWDAQKNRLRRTSEQGNDIAVSLPRNTFMQNGDVLAFDEASNTMIVAKITLRDVLIIEINELLKKEQSELVRSLNLPVVMVVGMRLGCVHQARATARAILADGCDLVGWIGNAIDPQMSHRDDNITILDRVLPVPRLAVLEWEG